LEPNSRIASQHLEDALNETETHLDSTLLAGQRHIVNCPDGYTNADYSENVRHAGRDRRCCGSESGNPA